MLSGVERNGVLEIVGGRNVVVWRCDSKTREEQPPLLQVASLFVGHRVCFFILSFLATSSDI